MSQKKDLKLVKKLLKNENKRSRYTQEELLYMEKWYQVQKLERKIRKAQTKVQKGFGQ